jgi:tRNA pseudouridine55 synthase
MKVRRILGQKKVGHTGTLDPMATGVLILCVGRAVKLVQFLQNQDKEYLADMTLGISTDTYDAAGSVVETKSCQISREEIERLLPRFRGEIMQIPPMVSAVKLKGERLYRLALKGEETERPARSVRISRLELTDYRESEHPVATLSLQCSKGTYVRTLVADLGAQLDCGAHVSRLVRTRAGKFLLAGSQTLERLEEIVSEGKVESSLVPMEEAVDFLPALLVKQGAGARIRNGHPPTAEMAERTSSQLKAGDKVRILDSKQRLLAIGAMQMDLVEGLSGKEIVAKLIRVM